jgi:hypothetical protein
LPFLPSFLSLLKHKASCMLSELYTISMFHLYVFFFQISYMWRENNSQPRMLYHQNYPSRMTTGLEVGLKQ